MPQQKKLTTPKYMEQTLTDWKPKHGDRVSFLHRQYPESTFSGVIRGSTVGQVLMEVHENDEKYVWFLKNEIKLV